MCGVHGYSRESFPPSGDVVAYESWLQKVWPDGRAQHTRLGFFIWHNGACERLWKQTRLRALNHGMSGWAHQHQIEMDRRRVKAGV